MNIVFDFDGTIANSTPYHRAGWESTIKELGLNYELDHLLPYAPNLKERFDSYRRIKKGFLEKVDVKYKICSYFQIEDEDVLVNKIMSLKESLTISKIFQESLTNTLGNVGVNLIASLNTLKSQNTLVGIISSTRETIISSFLHKCGILDFFDFIIGEESLTNPYGTLFDKPSPYTKSVLNSTNKAMDIYVGDNERIDKKFAQTCEAKFVYADYKTDFLILMDKLI